jgi:hypothetical protein
MGFLICFLKLAMFAWYKVINGTRTGPRMTDPRKTYPRKTYPRIDIPQNGQILENNKIFGNLQICVKKNYRHICMYVE